MLGDGFLKFFGESSPLGTRKRVSSICFPYSQVLFHRVGNGFLKCFPDLPLMRSEGLPLSDETQVLAPFRREDKVCHSLRLCATNEIP
jgi:hypothetical protein